MNKKLVLNITNSGKKNKKIIGDKDDFTIGKRPDNDLTLFGQEYPKKHTLIARRNGFYHLRIPAFIEEGEVSVDDSVLKLNDLIVHRLLPREKDSHVLRLLPNQKGYVTVGDVRIDFLFDRRETPRAVMPKFSGFSWVNATAKSLVSDLTFKFIFTFLLLLNAAILYVFRDYEVTVEETVNVEKVQERFAKFLTKSADEIYREATATVTANMDGEEAADKDQAKKSEQRKNTSGRKRRSGSGRGNPAASAGLLSLIGGTGSGSKTSSIVDAFVDKGLIADLKDIVGGGTNLKVGGKSTKDDIDPLDQLIGTGGSGGIDDFLASMDNDVEEVTLRKQVRVNLSKATSKSGSQEALGYRNEQSVMSVVNSRMGRITWLYEKYLKRQPGLAGKVTIEFTIAANGFVTSVKILESTVDHPKLENDLVGLVRRLKFEPIPEGVTTFVFPFHFKKIM